jgi:hypothetical protein
MLYRCRKFGYFINFRHLCFTFLFTYKKNEMNKNINQLFLFLLIIGFIGCKKHTPEIDITAPTIEVDSPTTNITYPSLTGDCHIEFTAIDDTELYGISVNIVNANGVNYYSNSLTIHTKTHDFHDHLVVSGITGIVPCTLKIVVTDKNGNTTSKNIPFNLKP